MAGFPAAFYQGDLIGNTVVWHWHEELELIQICRGAVAVGAGGASVTLTAGEGCFIKAGVLHNVWKGDPNPCQYRSVVFHPRLIGGMDSIFWLRYIQPLGEPDFPPLLSFVNQEGREFAAFFTRLWQTQEDHSAGYENDVRYLLTKFAGHLSRTPIEKECQPSDREVRDMERMKAMLSFVEAHYGERLTLEQIAESAYISETECMRCFRRSVGMSPIRFLNQRRLQHAAGQIRATERRISEIAGCCGFLDMSYFTRVFRQMYGVTPTEYRRGKSE